MATKLKLVWDHFVHVHVVVQAAARWVAGNEVLQLLLLRQCDHSMVHLAQQHGGATEAAAGQAFG